MSTAYAATAQAWAATQKSSRQTHRRAPEPEASSWRPPVTVFVKMELGISFGRGSSNRPHKVALGYPAETPKRTPRFLLSAGHADRRAASEDARPKKGKREQIPRAIAPAHTISIQRKPVQRPPSDIHPHDSASQVPTRRTLPRRSSSLNALAGSRINLVHPEQPPHPERDVEPRPPPPSPPRKISREEIQRKPLPETPSRFRLGENGMPWDSPHVPFAAGNANSTVQHPPAPHSARAAPSDWQQQYAAEYEHRSYSTPATPLVSPIVSPQTSTTSIRKGGHNRMSSWGVVSADDVSPNVRSASSRSTLKRVIEPPPLQAAPPNAPLPPVPRSPKSTVTQVRAIHDPVVETPILEYGAGHEETEDDAIRRELQEAKDKRRQITDPQRARELGELNAAMVGFEALDDRFYEPLGTWDSCSDISGSVMPRGTQSLGWAIKVETEQERADREKRERREARREARRRAKGKEPMRNELHGIGNASGSQIKSHSRPSSSGSEGAGDWLAAETSTGAYYSPEDVGRYRQGSVWEEYKPEEWENGDGSGRKWRGIERRRSWTGGEALEWRGQYWNAVTYR